MEGCEILGESVPKTRNFSLPIVFNLILFHMFCIAVETINKVANVKRIYLLFSTLAIITDQIIDVALIVNLFILQEFWFAIIYLIVDFFPAVVIMWHKFQEEKNWKVIGSIKTYKFNRKIVFPVSLRFCL